jgi:nitrate/nitrite-specific signal transduction histidine kinase
MTEMKIKKRTKESLEEREKREREFWSDPEMRTFAIEQIIRYLKRLEKYPLDEKKMMEELPDEDIQDFLEQVEEFNDTIGRLKEILNRKAWVRINFDGGVFNS